MLSAGADLATPNDIRLIPDCRVSVGGQTLSLDHDARLTRVDVDLDVDLFGRCELVFHDPKLQLIDGKQFESGTAVKVEIGFGQKLQTVFEGEVVALEPRFVRDIPPALRVVCQESLHRLALSQMTRAFNDVDDKEIVTRIAQEHGLSAQAPSGTKGHSMQGNVTDAVFLRRLAQKQGNHVRIDGRKLVVGPPPKRAQVVLGPDSGLGKAKVQIKSLAQVAEISVHGWDPKAKQEIVGKAKPEGEVGEGAKKYGAGTLSFASHEHPPADVTTAEAIAKGRLRRIAEGFVTLQADVIGNPDIVPGASVELQKMGEQIDGIYRVDKAVHRFSKHGYWITLKGVRTAKKTSAQAKAEKAQKDAQKRAKEEADERDKAEQTKQPAKKEPVAPEEPIKLEGTILGKSGPLKSWPFRLLRDGKPIGNKDLGAATTGNEYKGSAWRTDASGKYLFDGLRKGSWQVQVLLAGATAVDAAEPEVARESGHRSPAAEPDPRPLTDQFRSEPEPPEETEPDSDATPSALAAFEGAHFETGKALPLPGAIPVFRALAQYVARHESAKLLVVGHTDAVGTAVKNLQLSDDRAQAVAAYLHDDVDAWMRFYGHPEQSARWDTREDQLMLSAVPRDADEPYYGGAIDGIAGAQTQAAFRALQRQHGLRETGKADDATRRALIGEYMDAAGTSVSVDVETLACGERHLLEDTQDASEKNRRVDVFAFETAEIDPPPDACRNGKHPGCDVYQRWLDAVTERVEAEPDEPRTGSLGLYVMHAAAPDVPLAGAKVKVTFADGSSAEYVTDENGAIPLDEMPEGELEISVTDGDLVSVSEEDV